MHRFLVFAIVHGTVAFRLCKALFRIRDACTLVRGVALKQYIATFNVRGTAAALVTTAITNV